MSRRVPRLDLIAFTGAARPGPGFGLFSLAFAATLRSRPGIPLTAGRIAKIHAVASGSDGGHGSLLRTPVAGSGIGLY